LFYHSQKMEKINNKFIIIVIIGILSILGFSLYKSYTNTQLQSSITLIQWNALLNTKILKKDIPKNIYAGDIVKTVGDESLAIIEWWDGSVTRLWWDSSLQVDHSFVTRNLNTIQISFELFHGKTWSNVIHFLWENSYFEQSFDDNVASVRGTIFNIDLENQYLYVADHAVDVISASGSVIRVEEWESFSLGSFSLIQLKELIDTLKDSTWEKWNEQKDSELFAKLRAHLQTNLSEFIEVNNDIADYTEAEKARLYEAALSQYQQLNTLNPSDALFEKKLELKWLLISLAGTSDKELLTRSVVYDADDAIQEKQYATLVNIFTQFDDVLWEFEPNIGSSLNLWELPENIQESLSELSSVSDFFRNTSADQLFDTGKSLLEKGDNFIQNGLNSLINK